MKVEDLTKFEGECPNIVVYRMGSRFKAWNRH